MSFPRYPEYKDSGVEWLGAVPKHWTVCALSYRYEVALGKMLDEKKYTGEHPAPYLRNVDVQWGRINTDDLPQMDFKDDDLERYSLKPGDLLVCEGGEVGRAAVWAGQLAECYYQKALHRLRAKCEKSDFASFFFYTLNTAAKLEVFSGGQGKSTIAHLTAEAFRRYLFAFPPRSEQLLIQSFLTRELTKIDNLMAEQEKLIALLKEKRQAVIAHAVTKGLDPTVPMKNSGVEWLGEVPAHWTVISLGRVTQEKCDGPFGSGLKSEHYTESGVRVIRLQNIRQDGFDSSDEAFIDAEYYQSSLAGRDVVAGDVLIAGLGDERNTVGRACVAPNDIAPAMVKADCFRFRLFTEVAVPAFVARQLSVSSSADAGAFATGTTRSRIPLTVMATRKVSLPPAKEQQEIVSWIEQEMVKLDALCAECEQAIDLLKERRTALISAAVTGQIDVRGLIKEEQEQAA